MSTLPNVHTRTIATDLWILLTATRRGQPAGDATSLIASSEPAAQAAHASDVEAAAVTLLTSAIPQIEAELPTPYVDCISLLESLLISAGKAGELRPDVVRVEAAHSLVSAFFGSQHVSDVLSSREGVVSRWRGMSTLLFRAIRAGCVSR